MSLRHPVEPREYRALLMECRAFLIGCIARLEGSFEAHMLFGYNRLFSIAGLSYYLRCS